jgi:hypothetical protein
MALRTREIELPLPLLENRPAGGDEGEDRRIVGDADRQPLDCRAT